MNFGIVVIFNLTVEWWKEYVITSLDITVYPLFLNNSETVPVPDIKSITMPLFPIKDFTSGIIESPSFTLDPMYL